MTDRASAEGLHTLAPHDGCRSEDCEVEALVRRLALRDTGPRPDSGIDVERLARAISRADLITATDGIPPHRWDLYAGTIAKELAREYARLSTPRTETSE